MNEKGKVATGPWPNDRAIDEERAAAMNELFAVMAHELRNPLASIKNSLYVLHHSPAGSDAAARAMGVLDRQVGQLTRIVEDVLTLTERLADRRSPDLAARTDGSGRGSGIIPRAPVPREGNADRIASGSSSRTASGSSSRTSGTRPPPGRARVLIIEDNVDAAETLRDALELCDHDVRVAYTGAEGLALARHMRPDVLLCDLGLPGIDGFEVARAFRADEDLRRTFLVALSGYAQPEDREKAKLAGFDRHIAKPPRLSALTELIASVRAAEAEG